MRRKDFRGKIRDYKKNPKKILKIMRIDKKLKKKFGNF
jgi:hypothetical protein